MKKKNYLTIIIQPDWKSRGKSVSTSKTFEIPTRIFYYLVVAVGLLAVFGINGSDTISKNIILKKKVRLLESSLAYMRTIEKRVDNMCAEERIISNFVGYEPGGSEPSEHMGKGGTYSARKKTPDTENGNLNAQLAIEEMDREKPLHLRVCDLQDNLRGLTAHISTKNKKLNFLPSIMPVKSSDLWITSNFGWRRSPFTGMRELHNGLDISGKRGAPIVATADGIVESAEFDRYLGNLVTIRHEGRFKTSYGHMLSIAVKKGQKITRGQKLGLMGSTGLSTGYHVHYIINDNGRDVNPYDYILNRTEIAFSPDLLEQKTN
jgi:hypothetical protein